MLTMGRIASLLLIAFLSLGNGSLPSQPPPPAPPVNSHQQKTHSGKTEKQPDPDPQGTDKNPFVIKSLEAEKTAERTEQERPEREEKTANERRLVTWTIILSIATIFLALIAGGQLVVFGRQARRLRETVEATKSLAEDARNAAGRQATDMQASINEATRSATAMEEGARNSTITAQAALDTVASIRELNARQMRAYLTVIVGSAVYQERAKNIKFKALPRIINTGHTPAHKVGYRANAAILPIVLPADFAFPLTSQVVGSGILGPGHHFDMGTPVDNFCPDEAVSDIKHAKVEILYVWGIVTYTDVFGAPWETKFCHSLAWHGEGNDEGVWGYYNSRHNEAT